MMHFWNAHKSERSEGFFKMFYVLSLVDIIGFFKNPSFRLPNDRFLKMPSHLDGEAGSPDSLKIAFDGFTHRRVLNFHRHTFTALCHSPMDLAERCRGEWFRFEGAKHILRILS